MTYFRVIDNENRLRFLEEHYSIIRQLLPHEILTISDVKSILPKDRKAMAVYIAQLIAETVKSTTKNIKHIDGHKYFIDPDFINEKVTENEIKRGK